MQRFSHSPLTVLQFPCLSDNYGFLLRDEASGVVATVDTPDAAEITAQLEAAGWGLDLILNTHWHHDHVGGNLVLAERYGAKIVGPEAEGDRIPGRERALVDGDVVELGEIKARVLATPGHTMGHIVYVFDEAKAAFVGDTLFSLGCGRLFEGTPAQMWASLQKLRALPADTMIYCAHEYTAANLRFATHLTPDDAGLSLRGASILARREKNLPTVPVRLADEIDTNPFLRTDDAAFAAQVGLPGADAVEVFADIRQRKDSFA